LLGLQLALAGDDVLGLLGGVGVPAELAARLDLVDDGRGLARAVAAIDHEGALPTDGRVVGSANLRAIQSFAGDADSRRARRPLAAASVLGDLQLLSGCRCHVSSPGFRAGTRQAAAVE